jgi:hypothetical protein
MRFVYLHNRQTDWTAAQADTAAAVRKRAFTASGTSVSPEYIIERRFVVRTLDLYYDDSRSLV